MTSSGRSSIRRRISFVSGLFSEMELAMFWRRIVLPVRGRGHDEAALPVADRGQDIDRPHRDVLLHLGRLEQDPLEGVIGDQFLEGRDLGDLLRILAHDLVDAHHGRAALPLLGRLHQDGDPVAALQAVALDQGLGQERILRIEPVVHVLVHDEGAAVGQVHIAAVADRELGFRRLGEDVRQELDAIRRAFEGDLRLAGEGRQVREPHGVELVDVERRTLAGRDFLRQGVERRLVRQAGRIGQVAEDRSRAGRRGLGRMRGAPALLPAAAPAAAAAVAAAALALVALPEIAILPLAAVSPVAAMATAAVLMRGAAALATILGRGAALLAVRRCLGVGPALRLRGRLGRRALGCRRFAAALFPGRGVASPALGRRRLPLGPASARADAPALRAVGAFGAGFGGGNVFVGFLGGSHEGVEERGELGAIRPGALGGQRIGQVIDLGPEEVGGTVVPEDKIGPFDFSRQRQLLGNTLPGERAS